MDTLCGYAFFIPAGRMLISQIQSEAQPGFQCATGNSVAFEMHFIERREWNRQQNLFAELADRAVRSLDRQHDLISLKAGRGSGSAVRAALPDVIASRTNDVAGVPTRFSASSDRAMKFPLASTIAPTELAGSSAISISWN